MELVFPLTNQAISFTLEFYEIGRIKDYMFRFAGTERIKVTPDHITSWEEFILELHQRMEGEINQVILTTTSNTQVIFFEFLKEWLTDYRIDSVDEIQIHHEILLYNDRTYIEYVDRIEKKVNEFRSTQNFKTKKHKEEYEHEIVGWASIPSYTETRINYSYYCIEEKPELIDMAYFSKYVLLVSGFIANFKRILSKYVALYDTGKIGSSLQSEEKLLPFNSNEHFSLPEPNKGSKLKVNLSVPQLAYLFKMLNELNPGIFDIKTKTELYRFISSNFTTKATEGKEISTEKLKILFNGTEKSIANYWIEHLKTMLEKSRKI